VQERSIGRKAADFHGTCGKQGGFGAGTPCVSCPEPLQIGFKCQKRDGKFEKKGRWQKMSKRRVQGVERGV
jgi:hypothetical protein